jgi:small-conductance mechanosensitive channel
MEEITKYLEHPYAKNILIIIIVMLVVLFLSNIIKRILPRYIKDTNSRYRVRKFVSYTSYFLIIILILTIYSSKLSGLTVFLGIAGAGVAFALQEIITSIAGFIAISTSNFYHVGDRIQLGGIVGDVVDIGILRTSIMQVGDWVKGDLYNGKMVQISNSFIFKDPVYNYSGEFPFLWDEVQIPIRIESDVDYALTTFLKILNDVQGDYAKEAKTHWQKMTERLMIEDAKVEPMVTMTFDENWTTFTLRFVVDYKMRRSTKHLIFYKVLDAVKNSGGKLSIATSSMEITNV